MSRALARIIVKRDIAYGFRKPPQNKGKRRQFMTKPQPKSVLFVPNSNEGLLLKKLQDKEAQISRLCGYGITLVESSGVPLSRSFSLDLSDGRCHRADCDVCLKHTSKGSSKCKKKSVVYAMP